MARSIGRAKFRLLSFFVLVLVAFSFIAIRLTYIQGVASEKFVLLAEDQRVRRIVLPAQRGSIFDRNGAELGISLNMHSIFANPRFVDDPKGAAVQLAPILGITEPELEQKLSSDRGFVYLARKVDSSLLARIESLQIPGIDSMPEPKRFYPAGSLASHVVGFVGLDNSGLGGLESRYDSVLRGRPGEMLVELDPEGRSIPSGKSFRRPPIAGDDLVLTLDRSIQYYSEKVLADAVTRYQAKGGTIIVMKPGSGEILAMANLPTFDPNKFNESTPEARKNRALLDVYEPGSANKVITAAAAIESGKAKPTDPFWVPATLRIADKTFSDSHLHEPVDLTFAEIIEQSSNIGTIKVALTLGKERLHEYLQKFGYGKATGLDFPGETAGLLPKSEDWWDTSMGTIPIGQGVAVTAMQIVDVYGVIANAGVAVQPRLLAALVDAEGERTPAPPAAQHRVISEETASEVTSMLVRVTEGRHGTGREAAVPGYQVAGKTGTAQKPRSDGGGYAGYVGSFIGFAPASNPQLVVGVILDEPSPIWGGLTAAPAFREVMQFALRHLGIGPGQALVTQGTPLPAPGRSGVAAPDTSFTAPINSGTAD